MVVIYIPLEAKVCNPTASGGLASFVGKKKTADCLVILNN